jgi:putative peptide zinc metalloprotease protein
VIPEAHGLVGRWLEQGELLGHVIGRELRTVRVVLEQSELALVRERTDRVDLRLGRDLGRSLQARVAREVPAAGMRLPSAALGTRGGGRFAVDPADDAGTRALEPLFQLDLELPEQVNLPEIGGRAHARFHHGSEPIALRGLRALRGLLLRRLDV